MDLERIKQQLRLRSGRSKKPPKQPKPPPSSFRDQKISSDPARPVSAGISNGHVPTPPPIDPSTLKQTSQPNLVGKGSIRTTRSPQSEVEPMPSKAEREQAVSQHVIDSVRKSSGVGGRQEAETDDGLVKTPDSVHAAPTYQPSSRMTTDQDEQNESHSGPEDFDLRPPAPKPRPPSTESTAELLFSAGHLNVLLYTPSLLTKFSAFLQRYRPTDRPLLLRYLETSKALRAIEYANAVAENAPALQDAVDGNEKETSNIAAVIDPAFQKSCTAAFETLLHTDLPLYITYSLVRTISECLTDEITGRAPSYMRDMVGGLSEIFCLSDPHQEDNPIIYASDEFFRFTGYRQDDVIGSNCRFLQGPRTNSRMPRRIRDSLERGEEVYETLLNYRRDGKPFINLLMIAPLHDDKGCVKYHIGAQVDVTRLIDSGYVLEGFQKYMGKKQAERRREARESPSGRNTPTLRRRKALDKLRGLSELFDLEESAVVQEHSHSSSVDRDEDNRSAADGNARRMFVDSDASDDEFDHESVQGQDDWKLGTMGPRGFSGKLPGVYEKYMLIRPAPSLRIIFMSPKLQKLGSVVQSPFLSHIAAPGGTLSGLAESFRTGVPVAAKVNFMPQRGENRNGIRLPPNEKHEDGKYGVACWISATPLIGGDDRIGVWMVVFVEKAQVKAQKARKKQSQGVISLRSQTTNASRGADRVDRSSSQRAPETSGTNLKSERDERNYSLPIKPIPIEEPRRSPSSPPENQQSTTAYQYRAATPVEEYHSADEESRPPSPPLQAAKVIMPPQSPRYGISSPRDANGEAPLPSSLTLPNQRLRIRSPSDSEREPIDYSMDSRVDVVSREDDRSSIQDPNHIPPSEPSDRENLSDDEEISNMRDSPAIRSPTPSRGNQTYGIYSADTIRQYRSPPRRSPSLRSLPSRSGVASPEPMGTPSIVTGMTRSSSTQASSAKSRNATSQPSRHPYFRSGMSSPQTASTPTLRHSTPNPSSVRSPSRRSLVSSPPPPPIPESPPDRSPAGTPPLPGSPPLGSNPARGNMKSYGSGTARSNVTLPAGLGYLDHLRYSSSPRESPDERKRSRRPSGRGSESDPWSGTEGCRSPYSVD